MEKPSGSMRWRAASVAAQSRAMLPVLGGIWGSINATDNPMLAGGLLQTVIPAPLRGAVREDFLFPDRQPPLDLFDYETTGLERFRPVGACCDHGDARLACRNPSQPVLNLHPA